MITADKRLNIFVRDRFICPCGNQIDKHGTPQLAHRIKSGKGSENYLMKFIWGEYQKDRGRRWVNEFIIDNELNLISCCSLKCNDNENIFFKPVARDELAKRIIDETECLKYERMT